MLPYLKKQTSDTIHKPYISETYQEIRDQLRKDRQFTNRKSLNEIKSLENQSRWSYESQQDTPLRQSQNILAMSKFKRFFHAFIESEGQSGGVEMKGKQKWNKFQEVWTHPFKLDELIEQMQKGTRTSLGSKLVRTDKEQKGIKEGKARKVHWKSMKNLGVGNKKGQREAVSSENRRKSPIQRQKLKKRIRNIKAIIKHGQNFMRNDLHK